MNGRRNTPAGEPAIIRRQTKSRKDGTESGGSPNGSENALPQHPLARFHRSGKISRRGNSRVAPPSSEFAAMQVTGTSLQDLGSFVASAGWTMQIEQLGP